MVKNKIQRVFEKIKNNFLIVLLFLISTSFFIIQHLKFFSWDFVAYVLNAKYLFYNGIYFELYRTPIPSLLLAIFLIFNKFGEYIYIIFISSLFLYSNIKLSDVLFQNKYKEKKDLQKARLIFYFFSLSMFVIYYALSAGTELLSLALFETFIAFFISNRNSGHLLALATLSRYNFITFFPLLLLNRNYKKIIKNILLFFLICFPWFLFNYIEYGNWFASIVDSYALNIFNRDYIHQPFNFYSLIKVIGFFIPFFISGIFISFKQVYDSNKKISKENLSHVLFIFIFLVTTFDFIKIPVKDERYLFNLSLPIAYFSSLFLLYIKDKIKKIDKFLNVLLIIVFIISFLISALLIYNSAKIYEEINYKNQIYDASIQIKTLGIQECKILSPHWVPMHYLSGNVYPLGGYSIHERIKEKEIILIFKNYPTIDDGFNKNSLSLYPKLFENNDFVFIADNDINSTNCAKKIKYDFPYTKNHCIITSKVFERFIPYDYSLNICKTLNKN